MNSSSLAFFASAVLCASPAFAANIIDDVFGVGAGSFELPGHTGPLFVTAETGSNLITGWTVNQANIDWVKAAAWNPSNGSYSLDLNGTPGGPGGIQTIIPTTAGTTYRVTFDIAAYTDPNNPTNPKTIETDAAGVTTEFSLTASHHYSLPLMLPLTVTWSTRSFNFVATASTSTVSFRSTVASGAAGMLLDNVMIEELSADPVPEPSQAILLLGGSLLIGLRRRRPQA